MREVHSWWMLSAPIIALELVAYAQVAYAHLLLPWTVYKPHKAKRIRDMRSTGSSESR